MLFSLLNYYLSPRRLCLTHGSVSPHLAPRCYRRSSLRINPCGCPNKLPQTERLKTTEMDPLTVLEAGSRERGQGRPPSEASWGESFLVFSSFGGSRGPLALSSLIPAQPPSSHGPPSRLLSGCLLCLSVIRTLAVGFRALPEKPR